MSARRQQQRKITSLARDQACEIRLPGICNHNPETTVPCHFRMAGLSGMGYLPHEIFVAHGCRACHDYVDHHKDDATQLAFAHGVLRTIAKLIREGKVRT